MLEKAVSNETQAHQNCDHTDRLKQRKQGEANDHQQNTVRFSLSHLPFPDAQFQRASAMLAFAVAYERVHSADSALNQ